MNALLTLIVTWLALNCGIPANYNHPSIQYLPAAEIHQIRYGDKAKGYWPVIAVYDGDNDRILLPADWTPVSPVDVSVLVHEMVHHLQNKAALRYACSEEREALAYAAQEKWLVQNGTDLKREFGFDTFTIKVLTVCGLP